MIPDNHLEPVHQHIDTYRSLFEQAKLLDETGGERQLIQYKRRHS